VAAHSGGGKAPRNGRSGTGGEESGSGSEEEQEEPSSEDEWAIDDDGRQSRCQREGEH
jgi:hypothetical protein